MSSIDVLTQLCHIDPDTNPSVDTKQQIISLNENTSIHHMIATYRNQNISSHSSSSSHNDIYTLDFHSIIHSSVLLTPLC